MKKHECQILAMTALFLGAGGTAAFAKPIDSATMNPERMAAAAVVSAPDASQSLAAQYHELVTAKQAATSPRAYPVLRVSYSLLATRPQGYSLRSFSVTARSDADNRPQGFILTDGNGMGMTSQDLTKPAYTGEAHMGDSSGRLVIEALWRNAKHDEIRCTIVQHYTNTIGSHATTLEPACGELTSTVTGLWGRDRDTVPDETIPDSNIPQHT